LGCLGSKGLTQAQPIYQTGWSGKPDYDPSWLYLTETPATFLLSWSGGVCNAPEIQALAAD